MVKSNAGQRRERHGEARRKRRENYKKREKKIIDEGESERVKGKVESLVSSRERKRNRKDEGEISLLFFSI